MKYAYFLLIVFVSLQVSAQAILGEWQLIYIEVDGERQYSTIPNSDNYINFADITNVSGGVCSNGYAGEYNLLSNNTISFSINFLAGGCNYEIETDVFLHPYFYDVLSDIDASNILNYQISGTGINQSLQITNSLGNLAYYNRQGLPENHLPNTWYLHEIFYEGTVYDNTFNPEFNIQFETSPALDFGLRIEGTQICNDYTAVYNLISTTSLSLLGGFIQNPINCSSAEADDFEDNYRNVFGFPITVGNEKIITYQVSGTGINSTLILTNPDGDYALYGREQRLSRNEFYDELDKLRIINNPAQYILKLNKIDVFGATYTIYTINGKQVTKTNSLVNNNIDVSDLHSGLYFLKIVSRSNFRIMKFIKN